jgi:four helix bundle protein
MAFKFEKLIVWQKSLELTDRIHHLANRFPKEEVYVLSSQLRRSADSIVLNVAEGSTGQTDAEFKRFITYAIRSDIELVAGLFIARKRRYLEEEEFREFYSKCEEILLMLNSLKKSLKSF